MVYNTWSTKINDATLRIEEVDYNYDCHQFDVYLDDEYFGSICPNDAADTDECRECLDKNGASDVLDWEDGLGNGVSLEKDSDWYRYWNRD